jgi:hypothetical protein
MTGSFRGSPRLLKEVLEDGRSAAQLTEAERITRYITQLLNLRRWYRTPSRQSWMRGMVVEERRGQSPTEWEEQRTKLWSPWK